MGDLRGRFCREKLVGDLYGDFAGRFVGEICMGDLYGRNIWETSSPKPVSPTKSPTVSRPPKSLIQVAHTNKLPLKSPIKSLTKSLIQIKLPLRSPTKSPILLYK